MLFTCTFYLFLTWASVRLFNFSNMTFLSFLNFTSHLVGVLFDVCLRHVAHKWVSFARLMFDQCNGTFITILPPVAPPKNHAPPRSVPNHLPVASRSFVYLFVLCLVVGSNSSGNFTPLLKERQPADFAHTIAQSTKYSTGLLNVQGEN